MPGVWSVNLQDPEQRRAFWNLPDRRTTGLLAIGCAVFFILFLTVILPKNSRAATLILDRTSPHFPFPFTIQNIEHVLLFIGLGELFVRWRVGTRRWHSSERTCCPRTITPCSRSMIWARSAGGFRSFSIKSMAFCPR